MSATAGTPVQVILPSPAASAPSIGPKDFLVPLGTLLGAALGFGGAVTGARLAAKAQDKRSRQEMQVKQGEEERARGVKRLEAIADQANSLLGDVATLVSSRPEDWRDGALIKRDALRLNAVQMLGSSRLVDAGIEDILSEFINAVLEFSNAPGFAQARQSVQRCGAAFDDLMQAIGGRLQARSLVP